MSLDLTKSSLVPYKGYTVPYVVEADAGTSVVEADAGTSANGGTSVVKKGNVQLTDLNGRLLELVFKSLDEQELARVSRTSKAFKEVSDKPSIWKSLAVARLNQVTKDESMRSGRVITRFVKVREFLEKQDLSILSMASKANLDAEKQVLVPVDSQILQRHLKVRESVELAPLLVTAVKSEDALPMKLFLSRLQEQFVFSEEQIFMSVRQFLNRCNGRGNLSLNIWDENFKNIASLHIFSGATAGSIGNRKYVTALISPKKREELREKVINIHLRTNFLEMPWYSLQVCVPQEMQGDVRNKFKHIDEQDKCTRVAKGVGFIGTLVLVGTVAFSSFMSWYITPGSCPA